jgi:hypothetical protein
MKKIILISLAIFFCYPLISFSQEVINPASGDASGIYAECAAYYNLFSNASDSPYAKASTDTYHQLENTAKLYSLLLSEADGNKKRTVEDTNSRFAKYIEEMKLEADKSDEKLSSYHFGCQEALDNPPDQLVQILVSMLSK